MQSTGGTARARATFEDLVGVGAPPLPVPRVAGKVPGWPVQLWEFGAQGCYLPPN
jgi:hypothetical protein